MNIVVCPKCQKKVTPAENGIERLICLSCGLAYPVDENIPVMLVDNAIHVEWN
ncbi:MAG: Trm112 family protein [Deferribacteraceae bacterium]|nr:Trm112 family protein [Deferribacteraceae bacterium]